METIRQIYISYILLTIYSVLIIFSVYTGLAEAAVCCAWSADGRILVTGGEASELHLLLPPPCPATLCQETDAHDLGDLHYDMLITIRSIIILDTKLMKTINFIL